MPPPTPKTPASARFFTPCEDDLPIIDTTDTFTAVANKLSEYIIKAVDAAYTYEQLRTSFAGQSLKPLIQRLSEDCHHQALVAALMAAKYEFEMTNDEGTGLCASRGLACEIVAWQFLTFLSEKELIDYLLYELPEYTKDRASDLEENAPLLASRDSNNESAPFRPPKRQNFGTTTDSIGTLLIDTSDDGEDRLAKSMAGMNALEIAGIANAKKFLSQQPVQKIVDDLWNGNVVFWESLNNEAVKKPRLYNKRVADPFTRLRVPKYQKAFQIAFFFSLLLLYYAVLIERNPKRITFTETLLYLWIAAYAYDEFGEVQDAGVLFYQIDFWSLWDVAIIGVGLAFMVTRIVGLMQGNDELVDTAFDILSMVALFLVPRICSVMSLNPYFGSLIPVLKEMTKAFCKFLPVIVVLYLGFLTTFTMLARGGLTLKEMSWILIEVFFGSSYLGFDVAVKISPNLGYPLMLVFVCLTNILLITSLVSLVSNSLTEVMAHAREEYLFQYSIYVLESSTSRRLTFFLPPLNLIPLLLLRPLRLVLPSDTVRRIRIIVLKTTHIGFVALIQAYEGSRRFLSQGTASSPSRTFRGLHPQLYSATTHGVDRGRDTPRLSGTTTLAQATSNSASDESASSTVNAEMVALIQKLSSQVDDLTTLIAGQQKD